MLTRPEVSRPRPRPRPISLGQGQGKKENMTYIWYMFQILVPNKKLLGQCQDLIPEQTD